MINKPSVRMWKFSLTLWLLGESPCIWVALMSVRDVVNLLLKAAASPLKFSRLPVHVEDQHRFNVTWSHQRGEGGSYGLSEGCNIVFFTRLIDKLGVRSFIKVQLHSFGSCLPRQDCAFHHIWQWLGLLSFYHSVLYPSQSTAMEVNIAHVNAVECWLGLIGSQSICLISLWYIWPGDPSHTKI